MQVGEVVIGAGSAFERFYVRLELDEIAGDEAGGQADVPQQLHQQPCGIAAGAGGGRERLFGCLYARLHANEIADHALQALIEIDQKIDGVARFARDGLHQVFQQRAGGLRFDKSGKVLVQLGRKRERPGLRIRLDEEVERIDHLQIGKQIDGDGKFLCLLREDETREPIAVRVLLPVHEVMGRLHRERIARNAGAAVRSRPQPHHLRSEADRPVIIVARGVMEPDQDRHAVTRCGLFAQYSCKFRAAATTFHWIACGRVRWVRQIARECGRSI